MSADLATFAFTGQDVRVITDEHGDPWFVARDVCAVLDLPNVAQAMTRLADDEKGVITGDTPGGPQQFGTVSEPGLYRLIFTSRKAEADTFRRFVIHEVLPQIRKTGNYVSAPAIPEIGPAFLRQIAEAMEAKDQRIAALEPRAAIADTLISTHGDLSLRETAQALTRDHGIETGQNRLLAHLRAIGWVDRKGLPYQQQIEAGRLAVRTSPYEHPLTGEPQLSYQLRVTGKGLAWLHSHWPAEATSLRSLPGGAA